MTESVGGYIVILVLMIITAVIVCHKIKRSEKEIELEDRLFWIRNKK